MGFSFVTEIPSPDVIRERFPLAPELAARKKERPPANTQKKRGRTPAGIGPLWLG